MLHGGCPLWTEHPCWAFVPHHPLCLPRQPHAFISPVGVSVKTARPKEQSVRAHPGTVQDLEFLGGGRSHSSASDPPQHVWPCRRTGKGEVQGADGLPTQIGLWKRKYHYSVVPKPPVVSGAVLSGTRTSPSCRNHCPHFSRGHCERAGG